jgi:probable F420-dependent oxidoreductase
MDIHTLLPYKLLFPAGQPAGDLTKRVAVELESYGVAGLAVGDHIVDTGWVMPDHPSGGPWSDAFTHLAFCAAVTETITLVTRVIILPYRNPFAVAHAIATLDVLSGGRTAFGGAAGYAEKEFAAFGIDRSDRGAIADEYLRLIAALWEQETIDFQGRFFDVRDTGLLLRPVQHPRPPIWVGGFSHRAARRAVEYGDAWTPNCFTYQDPEPGQRASLSRTALVEEMTWAQAERRRMGKDRLGLVLSSGPHLTVTDTPAHPGRTPDDIQHFTGRGTPEELLAEYQVFKDAGADAFYVDFDGDTIDAYLTNARRFMTEVVPALA